MMLLEPTPTGGGGPTAPPAPSPTPSPTPEPSPAPAPSPQPTSDDPFAALDAKLDAKRAAAAAPPKEPAPEPTPTPAPSPVKDPKTGQFIQSGPKQLRDQLEKTSAELKTTKGKISALEATIKDYEQKGKDSTALAERLAKREAEYEALQAEVRALKQEASPEFIQKYDKPFQQSALYAKRYVESLTVDESERDAEGNVTTPRERKATWDDFRALYNMPPNKAITEAKRMFGEAAPVVIQHLTKLQELDYQKTVALEEERASYAEKEKAELAKRASEREAVGSMFTKVSKDIAEKHPDWFQPTPDDPDGNELLQEGYRLVDSAISGNGMTMQQKVVLDANIRHRAAAFPRAIHRIKTLESKLADAEATIAELKKSGPGRTQRASGGEQETPKDWRSDLIETMKS